MYVTRFRAFLSRPFISNIRPRDGTAGINDDRQYSQNVRFYRVFKTPTQTTTSTIKRRHCTDLDRRKYRRHCAGQVPHDRDALYTLYTASSDTGAVDAAVTAATRTSLFLVILSACSRISTFNFLSSLTRKYYSRVGGSSDVPDKVAAV